MPVTSVGLSSTLTWYHMWVEFVVSSRLFLKFFLQIFQFSSEKPTFPKISNLTWIEDTNENQQGPIWLPL